MKNPVSNKNLRRWLLVSAFVAGTCLISSSAEAQCYGGGYYGGYGHGGYGGSGFSLRIGYGSGYYGGGYGNVWYRPHHHHVYRPYVRYGHHHTRVHYGHHPRRTHYGHRGHHGHWRR